MTPIFPGLGWGEGEACLCEIKRHFSLVGTLRGKTHPILGTASEQLSRGKNCSDSSFARNNHSNTKIGSIFGEIGKNSPLGRGRYVWRNPTSVVLPFTRARDLRSSVAPGQAARVNSDATDNAGFPEGHGVQGGNYRQHMPE